MVTFLTVVVVLTAVLICFSVMLQPPKSDGGLGGLASTGGSTDSVLGANKNEFLAKATWYLCVIFIVSALSLGTLQSKVQKTKSDDSQKSDIEKLSKDPKSSSGTKTEPKKEEKKDDK